MRRARLLPAVAALLLLLSASPPTQADDEPVAATRLTMKDLFGGGRRFTKSIPAWRWRPGHAQLVRTDRRRVAGRRARRSVLQTMDPKTGALADLLDLSALAELVPGKGTRMRGIGRAGAPAFKWHADGKALCAVVKGDLVWVDLETGVKRRLTHTDAAMRDLNIASDGAHVSFSRGNELWVVGTKEGEPRALTSGSSETLLNGTLDWVYPEELGFRTAAWFSPDGKRIAYLQLDESRVPRYRVPSILPLRSEGREMFYPKAGDPNPKVRVGVVAVAGGPTTWVPLRAGAEYVLQVAWIAAGAGYEPFVLSCDRAQQTLQVEGGLESSALKAAGWLDGHVPVRWAGPRRWLRPWRTNARRWFLDDRSGDMAAPGQALTPEGVDAREILHVEPVSGAVFYSGVVHGEWTQGIFVGGPGVKGIHRAPFARDASKWTNASIDATGTYALVTTSDAITPSRTVLRRVADGGVVREIGDARAKALDTLTLAVPEYGAIPVQGMKGRIHWRLWKPRDLDVTKDAKKDAKKRYGLIVHVYGGPGSNMVRNVWGRGPLFQTFLCDKGYLVLEVDGRGTDGQGAAWLHSVYGQLGVLELEDQVTAVEAIVKRGHVDAARVGIWGWSYGGTMTCDALTMRSDVFKAGVAVAPVTDWRLYDTIYAERYMGLPKENAAGYKATSAITHARKMKGALLLMHGLGDDNVHAQNTLRLVEALLKAKNDRFDVMLYPRRAHGIGGATLDVFTRLVRWFDAHIGG